MESSLEFNQNQNLKKGDSNLSYNRNYAKTKNMRALSYVSLFSGAGVGCYGFSLEGFECVVTNELLEKRLNIQKLNNKCNSEEGYIQGDISQASTKEKISNVIKKWLKANNSDSIDVVVATPPCQGMSVANHKKKNEIVRNSLVVESINVVREINPKFFVFENVRAFLNTLCVDSDGVQKPIKEAIEINLSGKYNILYHVVNFKDYGIPSSRGRTLVIGVRKDILDVTPYDIFPDKEREITLREAIGNLPSLKTMGEIYENDIFHNYRPYESRMLDWIKDLKEGGNAFENSGLKKPHRVINGEVVYNANKNGDKYSRWYFDKVGPCIHTRNDILASQATIHPVDNRVYSIRELMIMMSIPESFRWTEISEMELNSMSYTEKKEFLQKNEMNIRQSIGEAVPTLIFLKIARKIKAVLSYNIMTDRKAEEIINEHALYELPNLIRFIEEKTGIMKFQELSKITELANSKRTTHAAYYTRQDVCFTLVNDLPDFQNVKCIRILEPSVGSGNFLPLIFKKYSDVPFVEIDLIDIDGDVINILKTLMKAIEVPANIKLNFIVDDFIFHKFQKKYNVIIGNPPFMQIRGEKHLLFAYRSSMHNKDTNNLFSFFIERALKMGDIVSLIAPKSLMSAPEFNKTRELIEKKDVLKIVDFGESAFHVLIETIGITICNCKKIEGAVKVESYITNEIRYSKQNYIFDKHFPYWLIYRDEFFDRTCKKLRLGEFRVFRDRQITKRITKDVGKYRVLKSRNLGRDGTIVNVEGYDSYVDTLAGLVVSRYMNKEDALIVPNLSYYPRAAPLPKNCIADGSLAILTPKNPNERINREQLEYLSSPEFKKFYHIARNYGTRSLNVDSNSVFFWGILKDDN